MPSVPFMPPGPPAIVFVPVPEPPLSVLLINQIDYYFSDTNLIKDEYLKSNMDEQGWVPIALIAGFPRVSYLCFLLSIELVNVICSVNDKIKL